MTSLPFRAKFLLNHIGRGNRIYEDFCGFEYRKPVLIKSYTT
jgi:hypothetical protein